MERLRQAGAVIIGKTVTTAYASFDPPVTRNPWNLDRTPGGSSSGSAAAVACGMCLGALATQTGGSITRPASYCGVCSLKPTYGRVSVDGVLPLAPSMDHVGVMANCVRDLAMLFRGDRGAGSATRSAGSHGPITGLQPSRSTADCSRVGNDQAQRLRVRSAGLVRRTSRADTARLRADVVTRLLYPDRASNAVALPAGFADVPQLHRTVMGVEAAEYHADRLARHPEDYPPRIRELIETGLRRRPSEYRDADALQHEHSR